MRKLRDTCQCERNLRIGESLHKNYRRLRIEYKAKKGASFDGMKSARYADGGNWKNADGVEVSDDLASLLILFIASRVPAGVLADKITEEKPDLEWVSEFLRLWDTLEGNP